MATLNEIIRQRRNYWRQVRRDLRELDTAIEKMQRKTAQILSRRNKVPETRDIETLLNELILMTQVLVDLDGYLRQGYVL